MPAPQSLPRGETPLTESTDYEQLIEHYPKLQEPAFREAFDKYIERMWTKPESYRDYIQAYLEFTTPKKLTFSKLNAMQSQQKPSSSKTRKSRRRRSRRSRRRSSSKRKKE